MVFSSLSKLLSSPSSNSSNDHKSIEKVGQDKDIVANRYKPQTGQRSEERQNEQQKGDDVSIASVKITLTPNGGLQHLRDKVETTKIPALSHSTQRVTNERLLRSRYSNELATDQEKMFALREQFNAMVSREADVCRRSSVLENEIKNMYEKLDKIVVSHQYLEKALKESQALLESTENRCTMLKDCLHMREIELGNKTHEQVDLRRQIISERKESAFVSRKLQATVDRLNLSIAEHHARFDSSQGKSDDLLQNALTKISGDIQQWVLTHFRNIQDYDGLRQHLARNTHMSRIIGIVDHGSGLTEKRMANINLRCFITFAIFWKICGEDTYYHSLLSSNVTNSIRILEKEMKELEAGVQYGPKEMQWKAEIYQKLFRHKEINSRKSDCVEELVSVIEEHVGPFAASSSNTVNRKSKLGKIILDVINITMDLRMMSCDMILDWLTHDNKLISNDFIMIEGQEEDYDVNQDTNIVGVLFPLVGRTWGPGAQDHTILHKAIAVVGPQLVEQSEQTLIEI